MSLIKQMFPWAFAKEPEPVTLPNLHTELAKVRHSLWDSYAVQALLRKQITQLNKAIQKRDRKLARLTPQQPKPVVVLTGMTDTHWGDPVEPWPKTWEMAGAYPPGATVSIGDALVSAPTAKIDDAINQPINVPQVVFTPMPEAERLLLELAKTAEQITSIPGVGHTVVSTALEGELWLEHLESLIELAKNHVNAST